MRRPALPVLSAVLVLACGGDGPTDPPGGGEAISLEIAPAALLLARAGDQQQLKAWAVDADGGRTEIAATFTTSNPGAVTVDADGIATGGSTIGSAQIIATSGGLSSAPALALRATPAAGALLVADSQLVGSPEPVDTFASYGLGWQERVLVRDVAASPGQLVIATGGAPIAGRIVAAEAGGNGATMITYELIPLPDLFQELRIQERIRLTRTPPTFARSALNVGARAPSRPETNVRLIEREFELPPFACKAEVPSNVATVPFSVGDYTADVNADLEFELDWDNGLRTALVTGTLGAALSGKPRITLAVEAKVECKWEWTALYIPIGGPISRFFGWKIPMGLGLELSGKVSEEGVGVDFTSQPSVEMVIGARCVGACVPVLEMSGQAPGSLKPAFPALADAGRIELSGSGFLFADMVVGWHFLRRLNIKAFEAKAGIRQKANLAARSAQAADPAYASDVKLSGFWEAGTSANVDRFWELLRISVPALKLERTFGPEARSPHGTLTITPATVSPGDGTQLGEMATFTVALSDVTYRGEYAVDGIEIRWQRSNGTTVTLEPGRPGCTDITASPGQASFSCQADFLEEHVGTQQFYAFVKTRLFGVPLPVPLEIAPDARATVSVTGPLPPITLELVKGYGPGAEAGVGGLSCSRNWENFEGVVSSTLTDSDSSTCAATGVDPNTGAAVSAEITGATSYTAVTSTGTAAGNLTSIQLQADLTGTVTGTSTLQAEAGSRGRTEICFVVAAGNSVGWQISGAVQAGSAGSTYVQVNGSGVPRQEIVGANQAFNLSGRLDEGSHCMELYYEMALQTSSELAADNQALHSTATLTFLP